MKVSRGTALAILLWLVSGSALAGPLRIGVLTMEPGEAFWERFGHNAIVVADTETGGSVSYNFGFFDMNESGFVRNFVRGHMQYRLVALPTSVDLASYRAEGRGVTVQWLALDQSRAEALSAALAENAKPRNARYRYDYYTANCSTRVRDALDASLDGLLKRQLSGRSQGDTYRTESVRLAWPAKWMAFGFHLALSDYGDKPLSRWDESFVPMRLRDSLRQATLADGRPLVVREALVLPHRLAEPPAEMPRWRVPALCGGLALAFLIDRIGRHRPRALAALALPFWLLAGLVGLLLLFLWFGTDHVATHGNENALLLNPLCLLLVPSGWNAVRGRSVSPFFRRLLWAVTVGAAIAGFLKFLPFRAQENVEWVLLLLPAHWALSRAFSARRFAPSA